MENKNVADKIKKECMTILNNKVIFNNCSVEFFEQYKQLYSYKQVLVIVVNDELISTAKLFLENNLNITQASKKGYMHRNTLIYRIDKIKRLIGLDIRNFNEAVVFENLVMFYDMMKHYK